MKPLSRLFFYFVIISFIPAFMFAGGPLYTMNGKAARYQSNVISYKLDRGLFGIFTSAQARTLANASFKVWEDVASSNVMFQHTDADTLTVDVNGTNFLQYTTLTDFKYDGINPIIFDSDGSITDALFGTGASASVIGFAGSGDANNDGYFDEGESVMNGVFANGGVNSFTLEEWKSTFVHEFGHFLGLDHTQINGEYENVASMTIYIPTMYPFATANDVPLGDLNLDDIAAISALYPEASFATSTGKISGSITRANASVVRGANVIAISTGSDSLMNRISTVSDYFEQNTGNYTVTGLTPGSYVIRIEPIDPNFIEGSSVGPYAIDASGLSFVNPVSMEYYNGINESGDPATDNPYEKTAVTVTANATVANINLIANGKPASASTLLTEDFPFSGLLTTNGWTAHSGITNTLSTTAGLTFSGYSNNTGNAAAVSNLGGEDVNKAIDAQSDNGTSIFASLLVKVTDSSSSKSGDFLFHLGSRSSPTSFSLFSSRLFIRIVSGSVNFGISNTTTATYSAVPYAKNTVYFVMMKYTINTAGNDEAKLWVFSGTAPSSEANAGTPLATSLTTLGQDAINAIGIRQGSSTTSVAAVLDGIRVGTLWSALPTGNQEMSGPEIPSSVELMQNFPNPFNPTTSIRFALPSAQHAAIRIFDLLGREIATVAEGSFSAGVHNVSWNGSGLSSGTYFYVLETENHREFKRMVLLK